MTEPTLKTFSILTTGYWFNKETEEWLDKLDQPFVHIEDEFVNDTERRVVIQNTEDQTYWAVNADYGGDSWGDESFEHIVRRPGIFQVFPTEIVVTQFLSEKERDEANT